MNILTHASWYWQAHIFGHKSRSRIVSYKCFKYCLLSVTCLFLLLMILFDKQKFFILSQYKIYQSSHPVQQFLPAPMIGATFPSSKRFIVFLFKFMSTIHLETLGLFPNVACSWQFEWLGIKFLYGFCTCLFMGHMHLFLLGVYLWIEFLIQLRVDNSRYLKCCQFIHPSATGEISSLSPSMPAPNIASLFICDCFGGVYCVSLPF